MRKLQSMPAAPSARRRARATATEAWEGARRRAERRRPRAGQRGQQGEASRRYRSATSPGHEQKKGRADCASAAARGGGAPEGRGEPGALGDGDQRRATFSVLAPLHLASSSASSASPLTANAVTSPNLRA